MVRVPVDDLESPSLAEAPESFRSARAKSEHRVAKGFHPVAASRCPSGRARRGVNRLAVMFPVSVPAAGLLALDVGPGEVRHLCHEAQDLGRVVPSSESEVGPLSSVPKAEERGLLLGATRRG